MDFTFRALPVWPYPETDLRRSRWTFRNGWEDTLDLLIYEIDRIGGSEPIIGAAFREGDLRLDGLPRANAKEPSHPGVEISFDSVYGRLTYSTDACERWQHNVRSIALGLEALRAVDRFGISKRGQQYVGFAQLTSGGPDPGRGQKIVERHGSIKAALLATHPDQGGDPREFSDVQAFRQRIGP